MKKLVLISTNFGTNFSGGCTATHEIFSRIQEHFSEVIVLCKHVGDHNIRSLKWLKYRSWLDAYRILKSFSDSSHVFYGDFYNAYLLRLAGKPFYFTYHDNWPELGKVSFKYRLKGAIYWFFYKGIFREAINTATVSEFKKQVITKYTNKVTVIRNGIPRLKMPQNTIGDRKKAIMVGNVDERKYNLAIELFRHIELSGLSIELDIYGKLSDPKIASSLSSFDFVKLKGFSNEIPFHQYGLLLHTSVMENLSLVWCEAIYHGLPVVSFDVGGASEVISKENGALIEPYDIEKMYNVLVAFINHEINFSLNDVLPEDYNWDVASKQYLSLFIS